MKPTLQLRLSQHLALTPQLQQAIRLLQLSTLDLNEEIEKALQENPLLEREDDASSGEAMSFADRETVMTTSTEQEQTTVDTESYDMGLGDLGYNGAKYDEDHSDWQSNQAAPESLSTYLLQQIAFSQWSSRTSWLATILVAALDDDGYLTQDLAEIAAQLPENEDETLEERIEELHAALLEVQSLDPTGVGARNVRECLELQLACLPTSDEQKLASTIVKKHLNQLANHNFSAITKATGCSDGALREAQKLIRSLDPRPGASFQSFEPRYVIPDTLVRNVGRNWVVMLNPEAMPRLRVNSAYAKLIRHGNLPNCENLAGQLRDANWLIKNVRQRFETILRVSQAIVDRQRNFFEHGEVAMRPLTLREIADTLQLHESTISRVTTQKYMASPRGVFELKYFFSSHVATETGGVASSIAIRALIKKLVGSEDSRSPLTDARIAAILGEQGLVVARRTVAKYREAIGVPAVGLRRAL